MKRAGRGRTVETEGGREVETKRLRMGGQREWLNVE